MGRSGISQLYDFSVLDGLCYASQSYKAGCVEATLVNSGMSKLYLARPCKPYQFQDLSNPRGTEPLAPLEETYG